MMTVDLQDMVKKKTCKAKQASRKLTMVSAREKTKH